MRLIVFALFLILLLPFLLPFLQLLFLSAQILFGQVLSNYWTDCSEIWGCGRYGCEVVQDGFKVLNVGL